MSSDRAGTAYALTVLTPILPGGEPGVRAFLEGLRESPFARLPRTHFARWVVVPDFVNDPQQPGEDHLGGPYLLFSATFDGELESYIDELGTELASEAQEIWGRCVGCPTPATGRALAAYLRHNQLRTGLFFAAYPTATVQDVRRSLDKRARTIALAARGQHLDPAALRDAFLEELGQDGASG